MTAPSVSVVVPTRDRPAALERCLAALRRQHGVELEVVVVDDGSREASRVAAIARAGAAELVRLDGRGPAAARNAGAAVARGEVICFTDDDVEPVRDWAQRLAEAVAAGAPLAGGRTRAGNPSNPFDVASERITGYLREFTFAHDPRHGFLASNNVACSRELVVRMPFDEAYGVGGEDRDWCARVAAAAGPPALVPDAWVVHTPGLTLRRFWRQQVAYGRGAHRYAGGRVPVPHGLSFHTGLVREGFSDGVAAGLLVLLAQLATLVGVLHEERRRRRRNGGTGKRRASR